MNPSPKFKDSPIDSAADNKRPPFGRPDVSLLDEKQWSYVQKCYGLSRRELQVAQLVCRGYCNEEVAGNLRMKCGTVKTHLRNIYRRLHVASKIQMLLKFVEQAAAASLAGDVRRMPVTVTVDGTAQPHLNPQPLRDDQGPPRLPR